MPLRHATLTFRPLITLPARVDLLCCTALRVGSRFPSLAMLTRGFDRGFRAEERQKLLRVCRL